MNFSLSLSLSLLHLHTYSRLKSGFIRAQSSSAWRNRAVSSRRAYKRYLNPLIRGEERGWDGEQELPLADVDVEKKVSIGYS
jgi:hypothetical protein